MELATRIAPVTGAQQGIAAAVALKLAELGTDVAVNWLDARPDDLAMRICALAQGAVGSVQGVRAIHAGAQTALGAPDILLNNAGIFSRFGSATTFPVPRMGTPEEIAEPIACLAGLRAGFMTGQVFHINGGVHFH